MFQFRDGGDGGRGGESLLLYSFLGQLMTGFSSWYFLLLSLATLGFILAALPNIGGGTHQGCCASGKETGFQAHLACLRRRFVPLPAPAGFPQLLLFVGPAGMLTTASSSSPSKGSSSGS